MSANPVPPAPWPRPVETEAPAPPVGGRIVERVLEAWQLLLGVAVGAAVAALLVSFVLPKRYTSTASFIPEKQQGAQMPDGISGLIGQVGLLSQGGNESPDFYQRLLTSRHLRTIVLTSRYEGRTLVEYYKASNRPDSLERAMKKFTKDYTVSVDRVTGIVRLDVELKQPGLAQAVTTRMLSTVDSFNSRIRRSMAGERRRFVEQQFVEARQALEAAEESLKEFHLRNRSVGSSPALAFEQSRHERRVQLANAVFQTLAKDLQTARIDEVNDTPVISIIDPPSLPVRHSSPRRVVLTLLAAFVAGLLATMWVLWRPTAGRGA